MYVEPSKAIPIAFIWVLLLSLCCALRRFPLRLSCLIEWFQRVYRSPHCFITARQWRSLGVHCETVLRHVFALIWSLAGTPWSRESAHTSRCIPATTPSTGLLVQTWFHDAVRFLGVEHWPRLTSRLLHTTAASTLPMSTTIFLSSQIASNEAGHDIVLYFIIVPYRNSPCLGLYHLLTFPCRYSATS
jgi:hypothetical protein